MKFFRDRRVIAAVAIAIVAIIVFAVPMFLLPAGEEQAVVYAATRNIAAGEYIGELDVGALVVPARLAGGEVPNITDIVGKYAVSQIWYGDTIRKGKITATAPGDKTTPDSGYTYVSVTVPSLAAGVAGHITRGDFVSVVCYKEFEIEVETGAPVTSEPIEGMRDPSQRVETIFEEHAYIPDGLERVQIVDVRNANDIPLDELEEESTSTAATVTLLVTPEQALKVVEAEKSGSIHFVYVGTATAKGVK